MRSPSSLMVPGLAADLEVWTRSTTPMSERLPAKPALVSFFSIRLLLPFCEDHLHAGDDLFDVDRLGQVVVAAELEPLHLELDRLLVGQEDERDVPEALVALELLAQLEAVHLRHLGVREHEIRRPDFSHFSSASFPLMAVVTEKPAFFEADLHDARTSRHRRPGAGAAWPSRRLSAPFPPPRVRRSRQRTCSSVNSFFSPAARSLAVPGAAALEVPQAPGPRRSSWRVRLHPRRGKCRSAAA